MTDTLQIFGTQYSNVTGIKAYQDAFTLLTYIRPQGSSVLSQNATYDVTTLSEVTVNITGGDVPEGYTQLPVIYGPRGATIDTGVQPNKSTAAEFKVTPLELTGNAIIGTPGAADNQDWRCFNYGGAIYWDCYNSRLSGKTFASGVTRNLRIENNKVTDLDTETVLLSGNSQPTFSAPYNIFINAGVSTNTTIANWFYVKIYQGDELVRHYIPCMQNSTEIYGMYDKIGSSFYSTAGSAHFEPANQVKSVAFTPTETLQSSTVTPDGGYSALGKVNITVSAISSTYVGTGVATQAAQVLYPSTIDQTIAASKYLTGTQTFKSVITTNLSASNIVSGVTIKIGDANNASRIAQITGTASTGGGTDTSDATLTSGDQMLSGYTAYARGSKYTGTIVTKSATDVTVAGSQVTTPSGYFSQAVIKNISAGSTATPATTITVAPAIAINNNGVVTVTNTSTSSITPTVTAGYISQGTAGTITVSGSNTSQLTSQAAQTLYPSTTDQTIASQKWLVGVQTFKSVTTTNLYAANIVSGVTVQVGDATNSSRIAYVTGTASTGGGGPAISYGADWGANGEGWLEFSWE